MASRGVLFAIDNEVATRLQRAHGDDESVMEIIETVEEAWEEPFVAETDKAWDAIHRALTDGGLELANGDYPLSHVVLGGLDLIEGDEYIAVLKSADQVRDIASAVAAITDKTMASRYESQVPPDYAPEHGDEDRDYTVQWFSGVRELYQKAAANTRAVLFTADQ